MSPGYPSGYPSGYPYWQLRKLQEQIDRLKRAPALLNPFDTAERDLAQLQSEVAALRLFVGVLMDVLVSKKIVSAAEIDVLTQSALDQAQQQGSREPSGEGLSSENPFSDLGR